MKSINKIRDNIKKMIRRNKKGRINANKSLEEIKENTNFDMHNSLKKPTLIQYINNEATIEKNNQNEIKNSASVSKMHPTIDTKYQATSNIMQKFISASNRNTHDIDLIKQLFVDQKELFTEVTLPKCVSDIQTPEPSKIEQSKKQYKISHLTELLDRPLKLIEISTHSKEYQSKKFKKRTFSPGKLLIRDFA